MKISIRAFGEFIKELNPIKLGRWVISLNFLDWLVTLIGVRLFSWSIEANSFVRFNMENGFGLYMHFIKLVMFSALIYYLSYYGYFKEDKAVNFGLFIATFILLSVVISNVGVLVYMLSN